MGERLRSSHGQRIVFQGGVLLLADVQCILYRAWEVLHRIQKAASQPLEYRLRAEHKGLGVQVSKGFRV